MGKQKIHLISRISLFLVYFWFGILKVFSLSPADEIVLHLHQVTIPFIPFDLFFIALGLFETLLGIAFLIPKITKYAIPVMMAHMFTTMLPLLLLPQYVWDGFLVPNLLGQYILKNVVLISLGLMLFVETREKQSIVSKPPQ
ncbi:hypothetical protein H6763_00195 [Candidatus Nomurabacteria bacterium]|uniref:DoxX family membrane protein n=1 Tax=Candidatus Dojkabacteria bacterium TaxID=2099670 RepID=A0A955I9U6_9BACT|nr:hypothetical protein [Candidatus Dojkabacteria bacterium]MCB9790244.1 hypothetical protein [Candidatus Nomurabacteria bacterium]MCB9803235.1 hypothetical protein [Candidatus Nomurabacteria bacterium]